MEKLLSMKINNTTENLWNLFLNSETNFKNYIPKKTIKNNSILVTGGTGFLGIHLLKKLIESKMYDKIYAIARNKNKVQQQVQYYQLNEMGFNNIIWIEGDILDLEENMFPEVEYIIHSAAQIHALKNIHQLWKDNIETTNKLVKIYQNQKLFFISTLSVFVSSNQLGNHEEKYIPINSKYEIYGGYAQSKWICEKIVENYQKNIIRIGLLTGDSEKGIFPKDFFTTFIKINQELKIYPGSFEEAYVDITPVDFCIQEIKKYLMCSKKIPILHIANQTAYPLSEIIKLLQLKKVDKSIWMEEIQKFSNIEKKLLEFAYYKKDSLQKHFQYFNIDLFQSTNHYYNIQKKFPKLNNDLVKLYIQKM